MDAQEQFVGKILCIGDGIRSMKMHLLESIDNTSESLFTVLIFKLIRMNGTGFGFVISTIFYQAYGVGIMVATIVCIRMAADNIILKQV